MNSGPDGPDECRRGGEACELLQHRHHVLGFAPPAHPDRQAESALLVNHLQELESAAIGSAFELEDPAPPLVGMLGQVTYHRDVGGPCPLCFLGVGRSGLPPARAVAPAWDSPSSPRGAAGGRPFAVAADVLRGDLP